MINFEGEEVCANCGLVAGTALNPDSHYQLRRRGSPYADPNLGEDPSVFDLGLGSNILAPRFGQLRIRRLARINRSSRMYDLNRSLKRGLALLWDCSRKLEAPLSVQREMASLYRVAFNRGLTRGRKKFILLLALYYIVCRRRGFPVRERELLPLLGEERNPLKRLGRTVRDLKKRLGVRLFNPSVTDYIDRFGAELKVPKEVTIKARELSSQLQVYHSPPVLACALLYLASRQLGYKLKLQQLSTTFRVSISNLSRLCQKVQRLCDGVERRAPPKTRVICSRTSK